MDIGGYSGEEEEGQPRGCEMLLLTQGEAEVKRHGLRLQPTLGKGSYKGAWQHLVVPLLSSFKAPPGPCPLPAGLFPGGGPRPSRGSWGPRGRRARQAGGLGPGLEAEPGSLRQDWGSLDARLQATLSSLYPPFGASAGVLLGQVLAVVERAYGGDGLRYLLDFLLPARHILHCVQLHACGQYPGRLFVHAGWPLCLGEHVVVHLASLDWRLLEPGDFYLQLVPFLKRQPRLVLTCLAPGGHSAQQLPLPEASYSAIFTAHWLDTLNTGRVRGPRALRSCLLVAPGGRVLRVPWEQVLKPRFLDEPGVESPSRATMTSLGLSDLAPSHSDSGKDLPESPSLPGISQCQAGCEEDSGAQGPQPAPDPHSSSEEPGGEGVCLDPIVPPTHATDWRYAVCSYEDAWAEEGAVPTPEELAETFWVTPPKSQGDSSPPEPTEVTGIPQLPLGPPAPTLEAGQSSKEGTELRGEESLLSPGLAQAEGQGCDPEQGGDGSPRTGPGNPAPSDPEDAQGRREARNTEKDPGLELAGGENLLEMKAEKPFSSGELEQCPASKDCSPALPVPVRRLLIQDLSPELLASGLATLPGTRDSEGRAVLVVCTRNPAWLSLHCSIQELVDLFLYLWSIPRPEDQARGLTVLVDARYCPPRPNLFLGLSQMQKTVPGCVYRILLLGKTSGASPPELKVEPLPSRQVLHYFISNSQLPQALEGCLPYSHSAWLGFRKRLEVLQQNCQEVCALLRETIERVEATPEPQASGGAGQLLQEPQELMQQVLDHPLLARLQREGGTTLAQLQREDLSVIQSPDYRLAVDEVGKLYAQVDELLHQLVTLCNQRMRALELGKMVEAHAETLAEIEAWLKNVGWPGLKGPEGPSLDMLLQAWDAFQELDRAGQEHIHRSEESLAGWEATELGQLGAPGARLLALQAQVAEFSRALTRRRRQLRDAQQLSQLLDQALVWAQDGQKALAKLTEEECASPEVVLCSVEGHRASHPDLAPSHFQEMRVLAAGLGSDLIIQQCHLLWARYQDTQLALDDRKLTAMLKAHAKSQQCPPGGSSSDQAPPASGKKVEERSKSSISLWSVPSHILGRMLTLDMGTRQRRWASTSQLSPDESSAAPPSALGAMAGAVGNQQAGPSGQRPLEALKISSSIPALEAGTPNRLHLILGEMVATEREYVRALDYVVESYFPELERADVPQGLRGQRARIFGNLEKLRDFHRHFFLRELESCSQHPLRVAHAFLRHREQFGMYALYSKNKPRSDALLASYGNAFFKVGACCCQRPVEDKQCQLGDHLDVASYLLKPIQRMSKYALLLQELSRTCEEGPEPGWACKPELDALQAAWDLVRFQLRHGNDLLAMDAIRGCDVNLKEQGQLIRQDEFMVWSRRKKCQRHIFLFEELILFSKARHGPRGIDFFIYKHSLKTADIGLTENSGESGLRFEIWFRRRKAGDTFVLQALTPEKKQAWTADIASLLWRQAARNKELRMAEMVSMGVGNKPFLDITPSEAAINDRAINYIMKGRGARTRASIAVFDHAKSSPGSPGSLPTGPSSCSLLGPLNLHLCGDPAQLGLSWPLRSTAYLEEELDPETETGSQPSLTPESSEASSQCFSASSSGSDSGCVTGLTLPSACEDLPIPPLEVKPLCGQSQYISSV
ncbi:puratrophin-1 [Macrotis lagotis]|uniref:puratrophin-1 n=1 Tax=Macrotis lagotis TaxID=92651 RepID=UPI003D6955CD